MKQTFTCKLEGVDAVATVLANALKNGGILLLEGTLASGKTTLTKALAKALHVKAPVSSPTFSIMQNYEDTLFHYDIYQSGLNGFLHQGLLEQLTFSGVHVIEWADEKFVRMLRGVGLDFIMVKITVLENKRHYEVTYA
ncbi:tRNA (adenosine(37)-N6)-threonylcarbamoyltransferase complex ATPase subunit type 1 TsaE [Sulfurospirillum sp. T05]|uniref:tRNA threonylcarbamoyladenosine biosynthesis protein TsaE n=1 Tax=Sulfurospirillum tamanense TaxID=2813362 RepID=A0ABS2WUM8_9BACT|nr:tRNA (adenosine(37)-N6)-threonylcarbamoyltransferase complex ATPase subunit type 1 TsaE [Sulfurospirillum tamanensis]MBN2965358.1 tRNA (adenosine(37)-N6)-threonylcarbamoyltransferase complex ATPase subunit type 1 TsaE [Sulfurospirillum tamanensis]